MPARAAVAARKVGVALALVGGLLVMHGFGAPSAHAGHGPTVELAPTVHELAPTVHAADAITAAHPAERPPAPPTLPIAPSIALCIAVLAAIASFLVIRRAGGSTIATRLATSRLPCEREALRFHHRQGSPQTLLCVQLC
jgi:hypothetical protein